MMHCNQFVRARSWTAMTSRYRPLPLCLRRPVSATITDYVIIFFVRGCWTKVQSADDTPAVRLAPLFPVKERIAKHRFTSVL
jgi:hypothetical protein